MFEPIADLVFALVTLIAEVFGGSVGFAIVAVTVAFRTALLLLTLRSERRAYEQRQIFQRLQPEIERLKERHAGDPSRAASEVLALYRCHSYQPNDPLGIVVWLAQVPVLGGFYLAIRRGLGAGVRFLGIPNLGDPSFVMALVVAVFAYLGVMNNEPQLGNQLAVVLILIILYLSWKVSAAMALYWASSTLMGLVQSILVRWGAGKHRQGTPA